MVTGPTLAVLLGFVLAWFVGIAAIAGAKWVGHEAKKGGTAIVHVLKKIPHSHHKEN
jgi:hypothetical protein